MTERSPAPLDKDFHAWWYDYKIKTGLLGHTDRYTPHIRAAWDAAKAQQSEMGPKQLNDFLMGQEFHERCMDYRGASPQHAQSAFERLQLLIIKNVRPRSSLAEYPTEARPCGLEEAGSIPAGDATTLPCVVDAEYEKLRQRCLRIGGYHPETKSLNTIGAIWADIYKRPHIKQPAAEMIVGYLSEFIDNQFQRNSERNGE